MGLDLSSIRFDARRDFLGVVMQQGRVQLDSDWNDWVAQLARRLQAGTLDTVGRAAVPRETPEGFLIEASGGALSIGPGRMYVDGLLAENHGAPPATEWDGRLAELTSSSAVDYTAQPYLPNAPALPEGPGPHLVYLDVWQREVSHLQAPDLIESAVGVDSTGRLQTVWQVKVLADVGDVTCGTPDEEIPGWDAVLAPSGARLSSSTGSLDEEPDPCQVPPGAGYLGLENQLYNVTIHRAGPQGTATFKWARNNATVATPVTHINAAGDRLTVESVGRDDVLRFHDGDWVEVTDDWRELHNLPGELRRIKLGGGVDDAARTIELEDAVTAGLFPVNGQDETDPTRHTLVRRWDQAGQVRDADGSPYHNLDAAGADGEIPVPPPGTRVFLEHGILVEFDLDPAGGEFHSGDHWVIKARAVDASIDLLERAAPLGIHHHHARLALVTLPDTETDCRTLWPPIVEGEGCDCTVCVTAEGHNDGSATLQQAVDSVVAVGGTVCLGAGTYFMSRPLQVDGAQSVRLRGQGWRTLLLAQSPGPVVDISGGVGVALENLTVVGAASEQGESPMVRATNVVDLRLEHCNVLGIGAGDGHAVALGLGGFLLGCAVRDCALVADTGIAGGTEPESLLYTAHLLAEDNVLLCAERGIAFEGTSVHLGETRVAGNLILGCSRESLVATGGVVPGSSLNLLRNVIHTQGVGVRAGTDELRIRENDILGADGEGRDGIVLVEGLDPAGLDRLQIVGNRLQGLSGRGLAIEHHVENGTIERNVVRDVGGPALIVDERGSVGSLSIEGNHFLELGGDASSKLPLVGVLLTQADHVDVRNNVIEAVGRGSTSRSFVAGLAAVAVSELRLSGNRLLDIGPEASAGVVAGLRIAAPFAQASLEDNVVRRLGAAGQTPSIVNWLALWVGEDSMLRSSAGAASNLSSAVLIRAGETSYSLSSFRLRALPFGASDLSVRGNRFRATNTRLPLLSVGDVRMHLFAENHCAVEGELISTPLHGLFKAYVNNVAHNHLIASTDDDTLHLQNSSKRGLVIGNASTGRILLDGSPPGPPLDALNLIGI